MKEIKTLKYQELIASQDIKLSCPYESCIPATGVGYRWVLNPILNEGNFLPNILYAVHQKRPRRMNAYDDLNKCSNCSVSMFRTGEQAKMAFKQIPEVPRKLLGYTHLATGSIENSGLVSRHKRNGHFELFEFEGIDLRSNFVIIDELLS